MPNFGPRHQFCIFVPPDARNLYGEPDWYDDDFYYCLPISPDAFAPADQVLGEVGMVPGFTRLRYQGPRRIIRGYEFSLPEGYQGVFYLLEHLAGLAAGIPYTPVLVKDFVRVERADYAAAIAANTKPVTQRQGILYEVAPAVGAIAGYWAEGFTFKFQEDTARAI